MSRVRHLVKRPNQIYIDLDIRTNPGCEKHENAFSQLETYLENSIRKKKPERIDFPSSRDFLPARVTIVPAWKQRFQAAKQNKANKGARQL